MLDATGAELQVAWSEPHQGAGTGCRVDETEETRIRQVKRELTLYPALSHSCPQDPFCSTLTYSNSNILVSK